MKKILAAALALSLSAAMFTACGDDSSSSSSAETTTTTAAPAESSSEEASSEEASSEDASSEETSEGTDESSEGSEEGEGDQPVDISEAANSLANYDNALVTFTADTDIDAIVKDMAECFSAIKRDAGYVEAGADDKGNEYTVEKFDKYWGTKGKLLGLDATYESDYVKKVLADDTDGLIYIDGSESRCNYSIEEVAGIPMLKVEILDRDNPNDDTTNFQIPKFQFKLHEIFKGHEDLLPTVNVVKMDIIQKAVGEFTGEDGTSAMVPGNLMGTLAVQAQKDGSMTWDQNDFAAAEWVSDWVYCEAASKELLIWGTSDYSNTTDEQYATIMRWGIPNDACLYIADIAFYDIDGNPIKF